MDEDLWRCFSSQMYLLKGQKHYRGWCFGVLTILDGRCGFAGLGWTLAL